MERLPTNRRNKQRGLNTCLLLSPIQRGQATAGRQEGKGQFTPASKWHGEDTICYWSYCKGFQKGNSSSCLEPKNVGLTQPPKVSSSRQLKTRTQPLQVPARDYEHQSGSHSVVSDSLRPHGLNSPEYWSGSPFPALGDLPNPGIKQVSHTAGGFFTSWAIG